MRVRRVMLLAGILATAGVAPALLSVFLLTDRHPDDDWALYRNADFHYELKYPRDWSIEIRDPQPDDDILTQSIRLLDQNATVIVAANFQGGWCESGTRSESPITVSGIQGRKFECGGIDQPIVLYFHNVKGMPNYVVIGWSAEDIQTVQAIIESFKFLD